VISEVTVKVFSLDRTPSLGQWRLDGEFLVQSIVCRHLCSGLLGIVFAQHVLDSKLKNSSQGHNREWRSDGSQMCVDVLASNWNGAPDLCRTPLRGDRHRLRARIMQAQDTRGPQQTPPKLCPHLRNLQTTRVAPPERLPAAVIFVSTLTLPVFVNTRLLDLVLLFALYFPTTYSCTTSSALIVFSI
jgi:hypothetical protein